MKHSNAAVSLVDLFTSDSYRLLHLLSELQTETIEGARIRESQDEIAELLGVSKGKLNPLMQGLMSVDCIEKYKARSGYVLTERGRAVLDAIERLKDL